MKREHETITRVVRGNNDTSALLVRTPQTPTAEDLNIERAPERSMMAGKVDAIERRYLAEDWTAHDIFASLLQSSLLSYRSDESYAEIYGDLDRTAADGPRYVNSTPEDYLHNCPWNNWTPPSKSLALFQQAHDNRKHEPIEMRIRVRISDQPVPKSQTEVAFASIEDNDKGKKSVVIRRGAIVLSSMTISTMHAEGVRHNLLQVVLSTTPKNAADSTASVCLTFEDEKRFIKFYEMVKAGVASRRKSKH
jgi:hypothetical protein